jgi:hypothetical protein
LVEASEQKELLNERKKVTKKMRAMKVFFTVHSLAKQMLSRAERRTRRGLRSIVGRMVPSETKIASGARQSLCSPYGEPV